MGRLHKKKLAEYAEAAENDEQRKRNTVNEKETEQSNNTDGPVHKSGSNSESEAGELDNSKIAKVSGADGTPKTEDEDGNEFQSLHEDMTEKNGSAKKAVKRKTVHTTLKKVQDNADENVCDDSDDEPLNGSSVSAPVKRGRKTGVMKTKVKAIKGMGIGRGKGAKKNIHRSDAIDVAEEEEYEVKDIVDHKVERGSNYYLIRWKGYTKDDDTWEAEDTLSCPDIIEKYKKKISNNGTKAAGKKPIMSVKKGGKRTLGKTASKEDPNKEWEVEKIIDYAVEKTGRVFRIRWKGFGPKNDTWEPEKNLYCEDLIQKFMKRMESQKNISFKELRETPKKTKRLVNETAPRTSYHNLVGRKSKRSVSKKRVYYGDSED